MISAIFHWKLYSQSCWTQSDYVRNNHFKSRCRWCRTPVFHWFQLFYFITRIIPAIYQKYFASFYNVAYTDIIFLCEAFYGSLISEYEGNCWYVISISQCLFVMILIENLTCWKMIHYTVFLYFFKAIHNLF